MILSTASRRGFGASRLSILNRAPSHQLCCASARSRCLPRRPDASSARPLSSGRPCSRASKLPRHHHDLESYVSYATTAQVNQSSTVFRGTLYEYSVQHILQSQLGISNLIRSGRAGDKGVDLLGTWKSIMALIQCKSSTTKTGARLFREMAGVHNIHVSGSADEGNAVILVASPASMTSAGLQEFQKLSIPIIYCRIDFVLPAYDPILEQYDYGTLEDGTALRSVLANAEAQRILNRHAIALERHLLVSDTGVTQTVTSPQAASL